MEKFTTIPEGIFEKSGFNTIKEACLKYCYTETGRQKIRRCRPEIESSEIRTLRLRVMEVIKLIQRDINLPFLNLSDLLPILETARAEGSVLSLEVFPVVFDHARSARLMKQFIVNQKENLPSLSEISGQLHYLNHLEKVIKKSVTENGELRDDASPKLRSIR